MFVMLGISVTVVILHIDVRSGSETHKVLGRDSKRSSQKLKIRGKNRLLLVMIPQNIKKLLFTRERNQATRLQEHTRGVTLHDLFCTQRSCCTTLLLGPHCQFKFMLKPRSFHYIEEQRLCSNYYLSFRTVMFKSPSFHYIKEQRSFKSSYWGVWMIGGNENEGYGNGGYGKW